MKIKEIIESKSTIGSKKAKDLATEFVRVHNAAAAEFKRAFSDVKARMWNRDYAHPIKEDGIDDIAKIMSNFNIDSIKDIYSLRRPLTVLDSYPDVTAAQRKSLDAAVDKILKKYSSEWDNILKSY